MVSFVSYNAVSASGMLVASKADLGQFAKASLGFSSPAQNVVAMALLTNIYFRKSLRFGSVCMVLSKAWRLAVTLFLLDIFFFYLF